MTLAPSAMPSPTSDWRRSGSIPRSAQQASAVRKSPNAYWTKEPLMNEAAVT